MLSLRVVLPALPIVAALPATHLAAFVPPSGLRRLYIARDSDRVGRRAAEMLGARAHAGGIEALVLTPHWDDFNTDLTTLGREALAASLRLQLAPEDVTRFLVVDRRRAHCRASARPCRVRPRRRPRPAFRVAMVPEAAEPRNGCARLSSPGGTPARLAPLGLPPFLAGQESRARRPPLRCGPAGFAFGCGPQPLPAFRSPEGRAWARPRFTRSRPYDTRPLHR